MAYTEDEDALVCRVCQCSEPDPEGEDALETLGVGHDPTQQPGLNRAGATSTSDSLTSSRVFDSSGVTPPMHLFSLQGLTHLRRQLSRGVSLRRSSSTSASSLATRDSSSMATSHHERWAAESSTPFASTATTPSPSAAAFQSSPAPGTMHVLDIRGHVETRPFATSSSVCISTVAPPSSCPLPCQPARGANVADEVARSVSMPVAPNGNATSPEGNRHVVGETGGAKPGNGDSWKGSDWLVAGSASNGSMSSSLSVSQRRMFRLVEIGCLCKGGLGIAHYACLLRWFVARGNTRCEICGQVAAGVRAMDLHAIMAAVQERRRQLPPSGWEVLLDLASADSNVEATSTSPANVGANQQSSLRRKRTEAATWFDPQRHESQWQRHAGGGSSVTGGRSASFFGSVVGNGSGDGGEDLDGGAMVVSPVAKLLLDIFAVLVAAGLMTITLSKLVGEGMDEKLHKIGLPYIVATIISLVVVIWFRVIILPKIRRGPTRYWAILLFFWFLIFGVWGLGAHVGSPSGR